VTNPYAGLGLTSGFFDAASLADCLMSVVKRGAPVSLFTEWSNARIESYRKIVDPLSRAAFSRVQDSDPDTVAQRDPILKAINSGQMKSPPSLTTDVEKLAGYIA
jgi:2-polyprenyl-6-methoxyphenol hydroxylase-like FAD-dependent oxidoreductase